MELWRYGVIAGKKFMSFKVRRIMGRNQRWMVWIALGLLVVGFSGSAIAHNGAVAVAVPVEGITIDGDLSDWPEGMERYPIALMESGDAPTGEEDFQGSFRIGYNEQENALYVAVEVQDESVIKESQGETRWDSQETCEIYLFDNESGNQHPTQYFLRGKLLGVVEGSRVRELKEDEAKVEVIWGEEGYQFEWKIDVEKATYGKIQQIHPDLVFGFDVSLWDKDEDGSTSMYAWGKGTDKHVYPSNIGFLFLAKDRNVFDQSIIQSIKNVIQWINQTNQKETILQTVLMIIPFSFFFLHIFLYLFYPRLKGNLYYSLFLINWAVVAFFEQRIFINEFAEFAAVIDMANAILEILLFPLMLRFFYSIFYKQLPKQFWILSFIVVGIGSLIMFISNTLIFNLRLVSVIMIAGEVIRILLLAIYRKKEGAWIIGLGGLFPCLIMGLYTLAILTNISLPIFVQYEDYLGLTFLAVILSMSIYLAHQFGHTSKNLETQLVQVKELSDQAIEQERRIREEEVQRQLLEEELDTAHDMQMNLMPTQPPMIEGLDIAGRCLPANHVGGDLFQYFQQNGKLSISLADVTGHAMEAAIPVVMFNGILDTQMEAGDDLQDLFSKLNRSLCRNLDSRTFVCFAMGELDTDSYTFKLSNGGCPYPFHYRANSSEITELQVDAYPLGVRPDTSYQTMEVQLQSRDFIIFCSDGIIEAENSAGDIFGFEQTAETIQNGCKQDLSAPQLLDHLIGAVKDFAGDTAQGDDMTCVVLAVEA
jgi:serine phosphatase RsbU (regulator of sigma subunit)